jgi:hypothetical protein
MFDGVRIVLARREAHGLESIRYRVELEANHDDSLTPAVKQLFKLEPYQIPAGPWTHHTGKFYFLLGFWWEVSEVDDDDAVLHVVYLGSDGRVWFRPATEWVALVDKDSKLQRFAPPSNRKSGV